MNPQTNKVYVANFNSGDITVIDATTLATIRTIAVGGHPTFIKANPSTNKVFAVLYGANAVAVIDGATDSLETEVSAGGVGAWGLALNPSLNRIYVSTRDSATITTIDGSWPYTRLDVQARRGCPASGSSPFGMDFNPVNNRLYVACAVNQDVNTAVVYSAGSGGLTLLASVPIGSGGADGGGGVAVDAATGHVFFTNSASNMASVVGVYNTLLTTFATGSNPFGAGVDSGLKTVYIGNRDSNDITVFTDSPALGP